jgi:CheY-like chemotaxis protein
MTDHTVLVVDDDPHFGRQLTDLLEVLGYAVTLAKTGTEAVDRFEQRKHDFVLTDLMLPGMSGVEVVRCIRNLPGGAVVPVMMTSAIYKNPRMFERELRELSVLEFLPKPFSLIDFGRKVGAVLDGKEMLEAPQPKITDTGSWRADELRSAMGDPPPKFEPLGTYDRRALLAMFIEIFRGHSAGALTLKKGRSVREVYFLNGYPVWAASEEADESLAAVLVKQGALKAADVTRVEERALQDGCSFRDAVQRLALADPRKVFHAERERVRRIVVGCFSWAQGDYEYSEGDEFVDRVGVAEVNPVSCLGEAVGRFLPVNHLAPDILPRASHHFLRGHRYRRLFPYLELPPALIGLDQAMESGLTVGDLFTKFAAAREDLIKYLWLMFRLGIAESMEAAPRPPERLTPDAMPVPAAVRAAADRVAAKGAAGVTPGTAAWPPVGTGAASRSGESALPGAAAAAGTRPSPAQRMREARQLMESADWPEAEDALRSLRAEYPSSAEVLSLLGRCIQKSAAGHPAGVAEARALMEEAVQLDPLHRPSLRYLAELCGEQSDDAGYKKAVASLRDIDPEDPWLQLHVDRSKF